MRKLPAALMLGVAVPALGALPVVTPPAADPEPVAPRVQAVAAYGVDSAAVRSAAGRESLQVSQQARAEVANPNDRGEAPARPDVLTSPRGSKPFELLGVTWRAGTSADLTVVVRTHGADGWTGWTPLDVAPTPSDEEGPVTRAGTEPLYAGESDAYQVRVDVRTGSLPEDLRVDLIDPGESDADEDLGSRTPAATASAAASRPRIYSRAQWGADERLRSGSPNYSSTIKAGFVHHTVNANGYASADVPRILRGIYAYHTKSNGWSDVGYNFLVDRFGRLWEGRYGGISRAVIGAHSGGFNENTFGVSAIGNFDTARAPAAMVDSIARLMAWKLSLHYRNPTGTTTLTSSGGGTSRYSAGTKVVKNVISAHRDVGYTACPGKNLYARMSAIRSKALAYMGAAMVAPKASSSSQPYQGSPITVTAGVVRSQSWRLEVRERCRGRLVRTIRGSAGTSSPIRASWNLRDSAGAFVRPGYYDLQLTSWDGGGSARPWQRAVSVTVTTAGTTTSPVALPGDASFVALKPARIYDSRTSGRQPLSSGGKLDLTAVGVGGVPATGVAAVALNVTATCPSSGDYLTVWPAGRSRPLASSLNLATGETRAAFTVAAVGGQGKVSIANRAGFTDVVVDVLGYYPASATSGDLYHPTTAFRLLDSRTSGGDFASGESRTLTMPPLDGVAPAGMTAAVLNVTSAGSSARGGYLTVSPVTTGAPGTSTLNYAAGATVANRTVTGLSSKGEFTVRNAGGPTHVIVDVVGWYAPSTTSGGRAYRALTPRRVLDTRSGLGAARAPLGTRDALTLAVVGTGKPVPAGAAAVVMTLTSTQATRSTYLTAWQAGATQPPVSDLNVAAGRTTANVIVVPLSSSGQLRIGNAGGSTHVVGDVIGYYK